MAEVTAPTMVSRHTPELLRVIRINEEIKKVVAISRMVSLTALNAKFISHQSGARSVGFGVVSTELRALSQNLGAHMEIMERLIFALVTRVALFQRKRRQTELLEHAVGEVRGEVGARGAEAIRTLRGQLDGVGAEIDEGRRHFRHELNRALKLCKLGSSFAQRAKVEAVYGNELSADLTHVSNQVGEAVEQTVDILKHIQELVEA